MIESDIYSESKSNRRRNPLAAKRQISVRVDDGVYERLAAIVEGAGTSYRSRGLTGQAAARREALLLGIELLEAALASEISYEEMRDAVAVARASMKPSKRGKKRQ